MGFYSFQHRLLDRIQCLPAYFVIYRLCHRSSKMGFLSSDFAPKSAKNVVGIFWDLDNKPPKSFPPYDAAMKLKKTASSFGILRYMVAYANHHAFRYIPPVVREKRKDRRMLNQLENKGILKPPQPYLCRICGRKFYAHEKLVDHFKVLHEREHAKRLSQIESAKGSRRVNLAAKYSMKMEKYKNVARDLLIPKIGYGLADELKRAGYWVQTVEDKPQAADIALKSHMVHMMDKGKVACIVLVSDDADFVNVLKEAKLRCLKTVVVGDINDGALKRVADTSFSWNEIMMGKAKKEAVTVVGKWKDRDVLKRLEWTYVPEEDKCDNYLDDKESEDEDIEGILHGQETHSLQERATGAWWKLDSDADE